MTHPHPIRPTRTRVGSRRLEGPGFGCSCFGHSRQCTGLPLCHGENRRTEGPRNVLVGHEGADWLILGPLYGILARVMVVGMGCAYGPAAHRAVRLLLEPLQYAWQMEMVFAGGEAYNILPLHYVFRTDGTLNDLVLLLLDLCLFAGAFPLVPTSKTTSCSSVVMVHNALNGRVFQVLHHLLRCRQLGSVSRVHCLRHLRRSILRRLKERVEILGRLGKRTGWR
mmetsp:Transcript_69162/g.193321  ORF Transcript_69162/g.193321 Transcript_69162/m.193321 type:complete len:224 (-) Transcript_69162:365-1036(-)